MPLAVVHVISKTVRLAVKTKRLYMDCFYQPTNHMQTAYTHKLLTLEKYSNTQSFTKIISGLRIEIAHSSDTQDGVADAISDSYGREMDNFHFKNNVDNPKKNLKGVTKHQDKLFL